jgi:hypothetical protein
MKDGMEKWWVKVAFGGRKIYGGVYKCATQALI